MWGEGAQGVMTNDVAGMTEMRAPNSFWIDTGPRDCTDPCCGCTAGRRWQTRNRAIEFGHRDVDEKIAMSTKPTGWVVAHSLSVTVAYRERRARLRATVRMVTTTGSLL